MIDISSTITSFDQVDGRGISYVILISYLFFNAIVSGILFIIFSHRSFAKVIFWVSICGLTTWNVGPSLFSILQYTRFLEHKRFVSDQILEGKRVSTLVIHGETEYSSECNIDCAQLIVQSGISFLEVPFVESSSPFFPHKDSQKRSEWIRYSVREVTSSDKCNTFEMTINAIQKIDTTYCMKKYKTQESAAEFFGRKMFTFKLSHKESYFVEIGEVHTGNILARTGSFYFRSGLIMELFDVAPIIENYPVIVVEGTTVFASNPLLLALAWNRRI